MNNRPIVAALFLAVAACISTACSSGSGDPADHGTGGPSGGTAAAATWESMDRPARKEYMEHVVLPKMRVSFASWEPEEFAKMKCSACHGENPKERDFRMPNPDLPKLPKDPAGFAALAKDEPQAVKFMKEHVVPEMAALLGRAPYDPATGQGFGCFGCHTAE